MAELLDEPLGEVAARQLARKILRRGLDVVYSSHFRERQEERNVNDLDANNTPDTGLGSEH